MLRVWCPAVAAFSKCRHQKTLMNQRGSGMTSSSGISLYIRARARAHHERFTCHACHAATALISLGFLVTVKKMCRYCLSPMAAAFSSSVFVLINARQA